MPRVREGRRGRFRFGRDVRPTSVEVELPCQLGPTKALWVSVIEDEEDKFHLPLIIGVSDIRDRLKMDLILTEGKTRQGGLERPLSYNASGHPVLALMKQDKVAVGTVEDLTMHAVYEVFATDLVERVR